MCLRLSLPLALSLSLSLCSPPSPLLVRVRRINSCMAKYANKVAELLATSTTARSRPHTRRCGGGAKAEIGWRVRGKQGVLEGGGIAICISVKVAAFLCKCVWV